MSRNIKTLFNSAPSAAPLRPLQAKLPGPVAPPRQPAPHVQAALSAVQRKRAAGPAPAPRPAAHVQTALRAVQAKIPAAPRPSPGPRSVVVQRAATAAVAMDYAEGLLEESKDSGARLTAKASDWIDLDTVKRSYFGWFSARILARMGIPARPAAGSICPNCGTAATSFELDHMTPWRPYIAALASRHLVRTAGGKQEIRGDAAKALYNDPENLWWICRDCNNPKSDIIPETAAHAAGDFSAGTTGRRSDYKPSAIMDTSTT